MADQSTYYAITNRRSPRAEPAGLVRRRPLAEGGFKDEALQPDRSWRFTSAIVSWKRAESTDNLVEVSPEEAEQIMDHLHERWATKT